MKTSTKILLVAGSLILLGCIVIVCAMCAAGWNFKNFSNAEFETNVTEIDEKFSDISIITKTADVRFAAAENGKCKVECYEETKAKHAVAVENGALTVKIDDQKSWYDYIGFRFESPKITVYLPQTQFTTLSVRGSTGNIEIPQEYAFESAEITLTTGKVDFRADVSETLKIKTTTGAISVSNAAAGAIELSVSTGAVNVSGVTCRGNVSVGVSTGNAQLTGVTCESLTSRGSTGNLTLNNVIVSGKLSIERSTGDVNFSGIDAAEIQIKTSTGDVTGSVLTPKKFITDTSTGKVNVPADAPDSSAGACEITTSTGDIKITIG